MTDNDENAGLEWVEEVAKIRARRDFLRSKMILQLIGAAIAFAYLVITGWSTFSSGEYWDIGPILGFTVASILLISAGLSWLQALNLKSHERQQGEDIRDWNDYVHDGEPLGAAKLFAPFVVTGILGSVFAAVYLGYSLNTVGYVLFGRRNDLFMNLIFGVGMGALIFVSPIFRKTNNLRRYLLHEKEGRGGEAIISKIKRVTIIGVGVIGILFAAFGLYAILFAPELLE